MTPDFRDLREKMVREQVEARGIQDPKVIAALKEVPRHLFMESSAWSHAYEDRPIPIGLGQTISQPFMVAYMAERLAAGDQRVLEVGTGSGYSAAVVSQIAAQVFSVEIEPEFSQRAGKILDTIGIRNVRLRVGDGLAGWPEESPFGRILLNAAVDKVPPALLDQLEVGGWFLGPVGPADDQALTKIVRYREGFEREKLMKVFFVEAHGLPMGRYFSPN